MDHLCGFDLNWIQSKWIPWHFFPIGLLGCGSFKAVAEDKHKEDLPGSEQWDRLSSCVLHKMPWVINFSVRLSFCVWSVTRAFDGSGAVAQMRGRNCTGAELCLQPRWNNSSPGLLCHASSSSPTATCQSPDRLYKTPFSVPHGCPLWKCLLSGCSLGSVTGYQPDCLHAHGW